jgi:hypothetical protein
MILKTSILNFFCYSMYLTKYKKNELYSSASN